MFADCMSLKSLNISTLDMTNIYSNDPRYEKSGDWACFQTAVYLLTH